MGDEDPLQCTVRCESGECGINAGEGSDEAALLARRITERRSRYATLPPQQHGFTPR